MKKLHKKILSVFEQGQKVLSEFESKRFLDDYGIPVVKEILVTNVDTAKKAANKIGYPVVVKFCSPVVTHKTEKGFIKFNISCESELVEAIHSLAERVGKLEGYFLIQEMVRGARELVIGMKRDPNFGPVIMFGLGGIFTEILSDVSFRLAPIERKDVLNMIQEIKGNKILAAVRGMEPIDVDKLTGCLTALSKIAQDHEIIKEIDVNPIIIRNGNPIAVDALIILDDGNKGRNKDFANKIHNPRKMEKFFKPKSVAIIGASGTPNKPGNDVIKNILANHFSGKLYLVNPKGGEIFGQKVYTSIQDLPENIDQGIIILPAAVTPQIIRECANKGIKALVLAAGGFAEVDDQGKNLQQKTLKAVQETGVSVIGPNTSGHISTPSNFTSSFFPLGKIPKGKISYIAQTGNFATHTMRYIISGENFGVARVIGLGNKLDIDEGDVLEYYADDPETEAVLIYLESFSRPRHFLEIAKKVTRSKPVILLKGGVTTEGAQAASTHTAAMASDSRISDSALRQAGVITIHKYSHLFMTAKALSAMPLPKGNRVSFLAPSGAMLVCLTDLCQQQLGLQVPDLEEKSCRYLQAISPPFIRMRNPVDIWPAATVNGVKFAYQKGIETVLQDPNIDAVVTILMLTDETGVPPLDFLVDLAYRYTEKPIYVTFTGQKKHMDAAKAFLEPQGVPTFPLIEEPFEVLSILSRCREAQVRK